MTMTYENLVEQVTDAVFSTMLNLGLTRSDQPPPADHDILIATVHIAGQWTGSVVLALSPQAARLSAAAMLHLPLDEITTIDQHDVASELVNMVGGNLKSLLPGPSFLSLPTVIAGQDFGVQVRDAELVDDVTLACEAGLLRVRVYAKQQSSSG